MTLQEISALIRDIPDFPIPGILFKDITPLLANPKALQFVSEKMAEPFLNQGITRIAACESRGFLFGPSIAQILNAGFVPVRKPGKLPYKTLSQTYDLEYGQDTLQIHEDAVVGQKVLLVDDLLATGGTLGATEKLIEQGGGQIVGCSLLIELNFLEGRKKLGSYPIHSILQF